MKRTLEILATVLTMTVIIHACSTKVESIGIKAHEAGHQYRGPVDYFLLPYFLDLTDSLLMVADKGHDKYFHFIDTSTHEVIRSYGSKGEGPADISFKPVLSHPSVNNNLLSYYDFGRVSVRFVSMENIFMIPDPPPDHYLFLGPDLINAQNILFVNDTLIVCAGGMTEGKLSFYDPLNSNSSYISFAPPLKGYSDPFENAVIYHSSLSLNSGKQRIISAMYYLKIIDIYTYQGKLVKRIEGEEQLQNNFRQRNLLTHDGTILHYLDVFASDSLIYAVHAGLKSGVINNLEVYDPGKKVTIEIYDYEGNFRTALVIKEIITSITVDESKGILFGLSPLNEARPVVSIDLKNYRELNKHSTGTSSLP